MNLRSFSCLLIAGSFLATTAHGSEWQTDYEQALASAKSANKCVLLNFTGSDWCPPCIQMEKAIFSEATFLNYAKKNLVLVEVDFPRRKALPAEVAQQNERLADQYGIDNSGYPTVVLLNPDGKILGQLEGYAEEGPADVIAWVEKLCAKSP